jgi:hypothetical protein
VNLTEAASSTPRPSFWGSPTTRRLRTAWCVLTSVRGWAGSPVGAALRYERGDAMDEQNERESGPMNAPMYAPMNARMHCRGGQ